MSSVKRCTCCTMDSMSTKSGGMSQTESVAAWFNDPTLHLTSRQRLSRRMNRVRCVCNSGDNCIGLWWEWKRRRRKNPFRSSVRIVTVVGDPLVRF